ncbi:MAG TPA: VOC family protein, partial [candidate division Zixibacteria bacterium]|nr:VOC family protein [candidate division Zixibacteria bacterium]
MNDDFRVRLFSIIGCMALFIVSCSQPAPPEEDHVPVNPMNDFGMTASNVFFYYTDLDRATKFYTETLGLNIAADYGFAKILQVAPTSFITLVDETKGMHKSSEPKTVAIALVTDQLGEWWDYIEKQDVEIKFPYDPKEGRPHHGFVAIDPEGYLLEFERFNVHEENEKLMPVLDKTATVYPPDDQTTTVPPGLGFKATVVWFYYKDMAGIQRFYEDVMGFDLIV